jgi:hypothetical protein
MSIIVPAGNKNVTWSPKDEEKLTKTASKNSVSKEISNPLYEAAKKFMATASDSCVECKKPMNFCGCNKDEVKEECKEVKEEVGFETSPVIEVGTQEGEKTEEEAKSKVEEAVTKLEEVVVDLKDATQKADVAEESEVEIEIVDDKDDKKEVNEVEIEVEDDKAEDDIPGKDTSKEEIIVESDEPKMDKSAATEEEFCRFAKLSPENKKKLSNYWVNMLNYPKDYVALMTKDYEK